MELRWLVLAATAVFQAGCITGPSQWIRNGFKVGPEYGKPPADVAPAWIQSGDPRVQSGRVCDWWKVFQDPTLDILIATAYRQNPDLRAVGTRVLQARAQQAIAVGNMLPQQQQALATYARVNLSPNMAPFGVIARELPNGHFPFAFSNWFEGFSLSWELDLWGRIRRNIESSNAGLEASVEDYDAAIVTLLSDVATNYVQYRVTQQQIKIAQYNVRIQEGVVHLAEEKFRVGTTSRLDVEQSRTVLAGTRATIPALEITMGQANDTMCTLLGFAPRDLSPELGAGPPLGSPPMPHTPVAVAVGIPADLLRRRPDVRAAERRIAAQSALIGAAEADLYPTLFINGVIGWDANDFSKTFTTKSFLGLIIPNFRWNVLNYGRILNNVRNQEALTQELIATYQATVLKAGREVQVPLRGFLKSQEQSADLTRSVTAASAATDLGVQQYRTGTVDFNTVFNLETTQVQQQNQLALAQGNVALNLVNVYRALGGGWELRLQDQGTGCKPTPAAVAATPPAPAPAPPPPPSAPGPFTAPDRGS
jgi:NodT family efflux transporter outer membrane factor (OMF) lipoprotein